MMSLRWLLAIFGTLAFQPLLIGCKCGPPSSPCEAFSAVNLVFSGQVEEVDPDFDIWSSTLTSKLIGRISHEELERLRRDDSPSSVRTLKDLYSELLPE